MSHTLATPSPTPRHLLARMWNDPDTRSTLIGLAGVLFIHLLLWLTAPNILSLHTVATVTRAPSPLARQFNIRIAPETFARPIPKPPPPNKFVEANPDAPSNIPDNTTNFSDRNQQAAQEKPNPKGKSDHAATQGKKDFDSTQIVTGQLRKPVEHMEALPEPVTPPTPPTTAVPKAEQNPLPGFEKKQGDNPDTFGTNIAKFPANPRPIPERIEGEKNAPLVEGASSNQPAIDPTRPRPRPQLVTQPQNRPAILADNPSGTPNIGITGYDAKWSAYGEYLKRLIEAVQQHWDSLVERSQVYPPSNSFVRIKFVLNDQGNIVQIVDVENRSSEQGARMCVSGITAGAPYGPWTDDMKAVLGDKQEMTFTFYYQ